MNNGTILYTARMDDMNCQTLAYFQILDDGNVMGIPTYAMYEMYRQNPGNPMVMSGGPWSFTKGGFLGYLATVAAHAESHLEPMISSTITRNEHTVNHRCRLTREMQAEDLANAIGYTVESVREYLHSYLVFGDA